MKDNLDTALELREIVTNSEIHMSRAVFDMPSFRDLQAIVTWYGDGRPSTLLMNRRNNARLLALLSVGSPIGDDAEREKQARVAEGLAFLMLSRFRKAI